MHQMHTTRLSMVCGSPFHTNIRCIWTWRCPQCYTHQTDGFLCPWWYLSEHSITIDAFSYASNALITRFSLVCCSPFHTNIRCNLTCRCPQCYTHQTDGFRCSWWYLSEQSITIDAFSYALNALIARFSMVYGNPFHTIISCMSTWRCPQCYTHQTDDFLCPWWYLSEHCITIDAFSYASNALITRLIMV